MAFIKEDKEGIETMASPNMPAINSAEITEWEVRFRKAVTSMVQFDTDEQTGGKAFRLYKGISGIEATWVGVIPLRADNYIKWTFSIQNGVFIEAKLTLDDENSKLVQKIYDFYNTWKSEWEKSLTMPQSMEQQTATETGGEPLVENTENNGYSAKNRTKEHIINQFSERMKSLAGIKPPIVKKKQ